MLSHPVATAAFLLLLGSDGDAAATPKQKMEFMSAMNKHEGSQGRKLRRKLTQQDQKDFQAVLYGNSEKSAGLREKLIKRSVAKNAQGKERKLQNSSYGNNANQNANASGNSANTANAYQDNGGNTNDQASTDDYFNTYGEWENKFGFDYSQFSLSYHRCASVSQFDDEIAATEDTSSVFATKHFAVFRFCPETTCMGFESEDFCDDEKLGAEYCAMMRERAEFGERVQKQQAEMSYEECDEDTQGKEYCQMLTKQAEWEQVQAQETVLYGARGEGCQENYGEYMIELEDYLSLMLEYQMERFEQYCKYCEECMYNVYQVWLDNGGVQDDDENAQQNGRDDDDAVDPTYYKVCPEYNTCSSYKTLCEEEIEETFTQYFECTEMESSNGQIGYIGPHCAEDGFTVTLGVYSDEYCNQYIGNGVDIANFLGEDMAVQDDALKPWYNSANGALEVLKYSNEENVCIPCNKGALPYEEKEYEDQYNPYDNYKEDQYQNQEDDTYEDHRTYKKELNEICQSVFLVSARCNKQFNSYRTKSKMAKYREAVAQEDLSCDFIDSVVMGNYNQMGFVDLEDNESQSGWLKNNMYAQEYGHHISEVSPLQVFGLVASLLACGLLALWSVSLQKALAKGPGWSPTRRVRISEPGKATNVERVDSGIMLGRTTTDSSYYMS